MFLMHEEKTHIISSPSPEIQPSDPWTGGPPKTMGQDGSGSRDFRAGMRGGEVLHN